MDDNKILNQIFTILSAMKVKMDKMEIEISKISSIEKKVEKIDILEKKSNKIDIIEQGLVAVEKKVGTIEQKLTTLGNKVSKFDGLEKTIKNIKIDLELANEELNSHFTKLDSIESKLDKLDKTEKVHFEYNCNKFERSENKIDTNSKYLDNKIDNTKDKLITEIVDTVTGFSNIVSKNVENVEAKIKNESQERNLQIDKLNNISEYDKIILKNLESRIAILEEETESYSAS